MANQDIKVLMFDDDTDILELCMLILTGKGYKVYTYVTCANIIDKVATVQPDVIFMDNWIPDEGGIVATKLLKAHPEFKKIPVIYFSANNDVHLLAREAKADAFLAKPFEITQLHSIIAETLKLGN